MPRRGGFCAWGSALPGGRSAAGSPPICPGTSGAVSGQTRARASDYRDCTNERVQARLVSRAPGKGGDAVTHPPEIFLLPSPAARRSGGGRGGRRRGRRREGMRSAKLAGACAAKLGPLQHRRRGGHLRVCWPPGAEPDCGWEEGAAGGVGGNRCDDGSLLSGHLRIRTVRCREPPSGLAASSSLPPPPLLLLFLFPAFAMAVHEFASASART